LEKSRRSFVVGEESLGEVAKKREEPKSLGRKLAVCMHREESSQVVKKLKEEFKGLKKKP